MGVIARYRDHLPVSGSTPVVTLGEGDTPLLLSERLSRETKADVWLKVEAANPTGSFKDRGMTVAVSKASEGGAKVVACASTGNTSASAAAYAARAGLMCAVLIPRDQVAVGKLAQARVHGAQVLEVEGNFDHALRLVRELCRDGSFTLVNSLNEFRIEGQKTAAFEIVEQLEGAPDLHVMPVGNGGNITAYGRGYREARAAGWSSGDPRMFGVQAEGAAPLVRGEPVDDPQTIASAIRIGEPASWAQALEAATASGGRILAVSDELIARAHRDLAKEGLFVEPASAASVAGLRSLAAQGAIPSGSTVACVLTGHGLKDPASALASLPPTRTVAADVGAIREALARA